MINFMIPYPSRWLFIIWLLCACSSGLAGFFFKDKGDTKYELTPKNIIEKGRGYIQTLEIASSEEKFIDKVFGTDCYSEALREIKSDCNHLSQTDKSRLAFGLSACHLKQLGQNVAKCKSTMRLKDCASRLDDRGYSTYLKFLAEIDSVCLFVQNQQFDKHTEYMLNLLYGGSKFATEIILNATEKLNVQMEQLNQLGMHLDKMAINLELSADTVAKIQNKTELLTQTMYKNTENEELRWKVAAAHASSLIKKQEEYRKVQLNLLDNLRSHIIQLFKPTMFHPKCFKDYGPSREVSNNSANLKLVMTSILSYVHHSNTLLAQFLGESYSILCTTLTLERLTRGISAWMLLPIKDFDASLILRKSCVALLTYLISNRMFKGKKSNVEMTRNIDLTLAKIKDSIEHQQQDLNILKLELIDRLDTIQHHYNRLNNQIVPVTDPWTVNSRYHTQFSTFYN